MTNPEENVSADEALQVRARRQSNLAFAFFCMSKDRARDMEIFYTYCRVLDDIADDGTKTLPQRIAALNAWKSEVENIYSAKTDNLSTLGAQLRGVVMRRDVPKRYLLDIIEGVMRDTDPAPFETFADIKKYCYGVASAVGLASIYIFGFKNEKTKLFAESLGYALQFTNILRDVVYDWKTMRRVYIPASEMRAFGVSPEDFGADKLGKNCIDLFKMLYFRAKHFFNRARAQLQPEDAKALAPAMIMWEIYEGILEQIRRQNFEISESVVKFSKLKKIRLALRALFKNRKYSKLPPERFGRAAVLGGGVAGVSAAVNLAYLGYDVDLYESKARLGGRASSIEWNQSGLRLDNSSHAAMGCYENFLKVVGLLGFEQGEVFRRADKIEFKTRGGGGFSYGFSEKRGLFGGGFMKIPKIEGFNFKENLLMLFKIKLSLCEFSKGESVEDFLEKNGVGDAAKTLLWEPFCLATLNTPISVADANMFAATVKKSLLRGVKKSALLINKIPYADVLGRAALYLEAVGGSVKTSSPVEALEAEGGTLKSFTSGGEKISNFDLACIALPRKMLASLLPDCPLKKSAAAISDSAILSAYFTSPKKLFEGDFAALGNSPIHWIFDRTPGSMEGSRLYSITVSAFDSDFDPAALKTAAHKELEAYFGEFEMSDFKPSLFRSATILSTPLAESSRPPASGFFKNAYIAGDWVNTGLPCTMESAAASAKVPEL